MLLLDLELRLQSFEKQLKEFGLPVPTPEELARVENITRTESAVIRDEMDFDVEELANVLIRLYVPFLRLSSPPTPHGCTC